MAAGGQRIARRLLDEATLTLRAEELMAGRRQDLVTAFVQRLDVLEPRRDEAVALVASQLGAARRSVDAAAARYEVQLAAAATEALDQALTATAGVGAAAVEDAGMAAVRTCVRRGVNEWRQQWTARLDEEVAGCGQRQQELLDEAVVAVRDAAAQLLGMQLHAEPDPVRLPAASRFGYRMQPDVGWNQPVEAAVRRRLPGAWGRRRVAAYLRAEAARLAGMHVGRARSDFQVRLHEVQLLITGAVSRAFTDQTEQLRAAVDTAADLAGPSDLPGVDVAPTTTQRRTSRRTAELELRATRLRDINQALERFTTVI